MKRLVSSLTAGLLIALFLVIGGQIVLRAIGHSLVWAEEASVIAFTWLVFAGAAQAYADREHLDVDLLHAAVAGRLKTGLRRAWDRLILSLQIVFLGVFLVGLVIMTEQTWDASVGSVSGFRYAWIYLGVAIGISLALLILLRDFIRSADSAVQEEDVS